MEQQEQQFKSWAVVSLFGKNLIAGKITEETISGQGFIRIDVPKTSTDPAFTLFRHPNAIYGINPANEEYVLAMAENLKAQPINDFNHNEVIKGFVQKRVKELKEREELPEDTDSSEFEDDFIF